MQNVLTLTRLNNVRKQTVTETNYTEIRENPGKME